MPSLKVAWVALMNSFSSMPSATLKLIDWRNGGLADADGGNLIGFDQLENDVAAHRLGKVRGAHPAGRAAADDYDFVDVFLHGDSVKSLSEKTLTS